MRASPILLAVAFAPACSVTLGDGPEIEERDEGRADSEPADTGPCASVEVAVQAEIPTVMLVVDDSASMVAPFGSTNRALAVMDTLVNPETGVVTTLEQDVSFGLSLYSSLYDFNGYQFGPCPRTFAVSPSLGNYDSIMQTFLEVPIHPYAQTPTGPAIRDATSRLSTAPLDRPRAIVLATDGEPNDVCPGFHPAFQPNAVAAGRESSIAAVAAAEQQHGIQTYVISVGNEIAEQHLQELANVGAGLPRSGPERAPFYRALDQGQLVSAFQGIIAGVRSCKFTLDRRIDLVHAGTGTVILDGRELAFETEWDLADSLTLELLGAACDDWKRGGDHELTASFSCLAIVQ